MNHLTGKYKIDIVSNIFDLLEGKTVMRFSVETSSKIQQRKNHFCANRGILDRLFSHQSYIETSNLACVVWAKTVRLRITNKLKFKIRKFFLFLHLFQVINKSNKLLSERLLSAFNLHGSITNVFVIAEKLKSSQWS